MRIILYALFLILGSCSEEPNSSAGALVTVKTRDSVDWLVPVDQVFDGGPGKDGIPALENPEMVPASAIDYLSPRSLVVGFKSGEDIRAYPHAILDWHEIINDAYADKNVAITYCPLTGTAIAWNNAVNGSITTFGVSGLLFQSNLMPYDRLTNSTWSQMRLDCINGELIGSRIETYQVIETTWDTWKKMYPNTKVNSLNTGFIRDYDRFPYIQNGQDYRTSNSYFLFPFSPVDDRLPLKERVLGVLKDGKARVYPISKLDLELNVITDRFAEDELVIVGSRRDNFIAAFYPQTEEGDAIRGLSPFDGQLPVVMVDEEGNHWSVFGEAMDGPRRGQKLSATQSFIGYWFTFGSFYPTPEIFGEDP